MYKKHKQYRLPNFDYASNGYYFVTICTHNKAHFFGEIINQRMILSPVGNFTLENILQFCKMEDVENPYTANPFFIKNDDTIFGITAWQILPTHIHLIVEVINNVRREYNPIIGLSPLAKGSLSLFINHFKGHITKFGNKNNIVDFKWQSKFHDRIIRNDTEYKNIAAYINSNVLNWEEDDLFS